MCRDCPQIYIKWRTLRERERESESEKDREREQEKERARKSERDQQKINKIEINTYLFMN